MADAAQELINQGNRSPEDRDVITILQALLVLNQNDPNQFNRWVPRVVTMLDEIDPEIEVTADSLRQEINALNQQAGPTVGPAGSSGTPTPPSPGTVQVSRPGESARGRPSAQQAGAGQASAGAALAGQSNVGADPSSLLEGEGQREGPQPLGVPEGFVALRSPSQESLGVAGRAGVSPPGAIPRPARYFENDEWIGFQNLDPLLIQQLQNRLVGAGLLKRDDFWLGAWDESTMKAMRTAMEFANRGGTTWQEVVTRRESLPQSKLDDAADGFKQFIPPPQLEPDMATLRQNVKSMFRQELGRDPTESELREMTGAQEGLIAEAQQRETEQARGQFFREQFPDTFNPERRAFERRTGQEVEPAGGPRTVEDFDPAARFAELFEQRMGPEIRRNERVANVASSNANIMQSLLTMQRLIG